MESNEWAAQLNELDQLKAATVREAHVTPRGAIVAIVAAIAIFWAAAATLPDKLAWIFAIAYVAFVIGWGQWLGRRRRAAARQLSMRERRRVALGGLIAIAVATLLATLLESAAAIGLVYGAFGAGFGWWLSRRMRKAA